MLNNYTVKLKAVKNSAKGLTDLANYLFDSETKSHQETKIFSLLNDENNFLNQVINAEREREIERTKNRKGGRPSTEFAKSFTFNFPTEFEKLIDEETSKKILFSVLKDIADYLKVDKNEIAKKSLSVFHNQKNNHIHLLIGTVLNGEKNRDLKSPAFLKFVKKSFSLHTDKILKTDIKKYKPTTKKTFDKREIAITEKYTREAILKFLHIETDPKQKEFLNDTLKMFDAGKTVKAAKRINKYSSNLQR